MLTIARLMIAVVCVHSHLPGRNPNGSGDSEVPLVQALIDADIPRFEKLLEEGADVNARDVITPLYAAQEYVPNNKKRYAAIRRLLKAGALVDYPTQDGSTTLMLAAYNGDVRSAQMLLDHGANPLMTNMEGNDAIKAARAGGHHELAIMIEEHLGESARRHMGDLANMESKVEL
jgi:ankyrin repeat protein